MNPNFLENPRAQRLLYVALAALIAIFYDIFYAGKEKGLGFALFVFLFIFGFTTVTAVTNHWRNRLAFLLIIPIAILSLDVMLYTNNLVSRFVPLVVWLLLFFYVVLLTLNNTGKHIFHLSKIAAFVRLEKFFWKWRDIYLDVLRWGKEKPTYKIYEKIALGVVVSLPILFIFIFLFARADVVFADLIFNIFDWDIDGNLANKILIQIWRGIRTLFITLFFGGIFYFLTSKEHELLEKIVKLPRQFDSVTVATIFTLINLLFVFFIFFQLKYLFGSADFVMINGYTYAEYARKGFFELVWVMVIVMGVELLFFRSFARRETLKLVNYLQIFLIAQAAVVAMSALKRMNLYQNAYGFTVSRLYAEWFIYFLLFLSVGFVVVLIAKRTFREFFYASMIFGLLAFVIVASINVDQMIAKKNIDRALLQKKELDTIYLCQDLSLDALSEINRLAQDPVMSEKVVFIIENEKVSPLFKVQNDEKMRCFLVKPQTQVNRHDSILETNFSVLRAQSILKTL